jgi:hypothetical protein
MSGHDTDKHLPYKVAEEQDQRIDYTERWKTIPSIKKAGKANNLDGIELSIAIAKHALTSAFSDAESDPEAAIIDMLVDIRHLCDALGIMFELKDASASHHYMEELFEKNNEHETLT